MGTFSKLVSRATHKLHAIRDSQILRVPPRARQPYLTHIPVLLSVPRWRPIRHVLEFGCGDFSTGTFLAPRFFPDLERIVSVENDVGWANRLKDRFKDDGRLRFALAANKVADVVAELDLEKFDLIFIDDSQTLNERCATIQSVTDRRPQRALVIIHDFECLPYRRASAAFRHRFRLSSITPNTGALWNFGSSLKKLLSRLNQQIRDMGEQPTIEAWADVLENDIHSATAFNLQDASYKNAKTNIDHGW